MISFLLKVYLIFSSLLYLHLYCSRQKFRLWGNCKYFYHFRISDDAKNMLFQKNSAPTPRCFRSTIYAVGKRDKERVHLEVGSPPNLKNKLLTKIRACLKMQSRIPWWRFKIWWSRFRTRWYRSLDALMQVLGCVNG